MSGSVQVRIAGVDPNSYSGNGGRFVNQIGEIVGVSGQFVQVKLTCDAMGNKMNDSCEHLFLPIELSAVKTQVGEGDK